jgi:hypothetical protein
MCCCFIILLHLPCYFSTQSDPTRFIQFIGMVGRTISRTVVTSHHFPVDDCLEKNIDEWCALSATMASSCYTIVDNFCTSQHFPVVLPFVLLYVTPTSLLLLKRFRVPLRSENKKGKKKNKRKKRGGCRDSRHVYMLLRKVSLFLFYWWRMGSALHVLDSYCDENIALDFVCSLVLTGPTSEVTLTAWRNGYV